ncbi:MAG: electron transfer flavoprotein subunit alpha/FixB family protein, partial [Bacteroidota bacterium]
MSSILVFVETADGQIKKSSLEAVAYGSGMGGEVTALVLGNEVDESAVASLGNYGASKVLHADDQRLNQGVIQAYSSVIGQAMEAENSDVLILANSSLGNPVSARVSVKLGASLVSNATELPDTSNGFKVKRSIYTGKAFANVELTKDKKIIAIKKNAAEVKETGGSASVEKFQASLSDSDF